MVPLHAWEKIPDRKPEITVDKECLEETNERQVGNNTSERTKRTKASFLYYKEELLDFCYFWCAQKQEENPRDSE